MSFWDNLKDSLSGIGDVFSTLFNPIGTIANVWSTVEGVKENKKVNDLNYQLQTDDLSYKKDLQKLMFQREDNAVQRRVADLKAAGLSPTLAAGSSASAGSVVSTVAPQKVSNLQGYLALAQVGTMLANQQRAQTEADIARQQLKQTKLDTKYLVDRGLAPLEVNQDWKARLLNLLYPKMEEALFGEDTKSSLFGGIVQTLIDDLKNRPASGASVDPKTNEIVNDKGDSLSSSQVSLLKAKGLYREWLNAGMTDRVKKALGI